MNKTTCQIGSRDSRSLRIDVSAAPAAPFPFLLGRINQMFYRKHNIVRRVPNDTLSSSDKKDPSYMSHARRKQISILASVDSDSTIVGQAGDPHE
jgi:hypothetical protein